MSRCRKPECITTPYPTTVRVLQIVILCLLVLRVPQKCNIIDTFLLDVVGLGEVKERQKWISKAKHE